MAGRIIKFTKGSDAFKKVRPHLVLSNLEKTLKIHCSQKCDPKNKFISLIHPTARSLTCIDMAFSMGMYDWSGYILKTFGHIHQLAKIMSHMILLDLLYSIFTPEYMRTMEVNESNMNFLSSNMQALFIKWRLPDILLDLENEFKMTLCWYIAIGLIPVKKHEPRNAVCKKLDKLSMYVYIYVTALTNKKRYDIHPPSFSQDLVVTSNSIGQLFATDYHGNIVKLLSFKPFYHNPCSTHLSVLDQLIWQEIQLMHAEKTCVERIMVKQNQTVLVVSSEQDPRLFSKYVQKKEREENENLAIESLKKEVKKSLDSVSIEVRDQVIGLNPENVNVLDEVKNLRYEIQLNKDTTRRSEIDFLPSADFYMSPAHRAGTMTDPLKDTQVIVQHEKMKDAVTVLRKECDIHKQRSKSLETDLKNYMQENQKLHLLSKANSIELRHLKTLKGDTEKKLHVSDKKLHVLQEQLDNMGKTMKKLLEETTMSKEERDKYIELYLSTCNQKNAPHHTHEEVLRAVTQIFQTIPKKKLADYETIELLLERLHILPVPIIPNIESKYSLEIYNSWMPELWLCDKLTNLCATGLQDKIIQNTPNILVSTPYMQVIDINPMIITSDESPTTYSNEISNGTNKKFMNVQFPQNGDLGKMKDSLKNKWDENVHILFCLSKQMYTETGSKLDPMLTIESIYKFVLPFIRELLCPISDFIHCDQYIDTVLNIQQDERTMSNMVNNFFNSKIIIDDLQSQKVKQKFSC